MCNLRFFVLAIFLFGGLAKALAQSPLILDVESDMETDPLIWVSYGLEYHSGLDMIPEPGICRSEAEPPVNANTGYWIRCVGAPGIFMIGIYLYNTGISESPKYLAVSAYFPPGIENQLRMSYGGESDIYLDVDNDWKLTIIDVQDYAIHPESTITIFVEGAGVIIDKIMVLYEDISTTTTELTTTESETTTEDTVDTTEPPTTTDDTADTEPHTTTDDTADTEPPTTTDDTADTEPHTTTDDTADTEPPTTTDDTADTEPPTTTDDTADTEPPTTTDDTADTEPPTTTDDTADTEPPTTTDDTADTEPPTTTDDTADTEPPTTTDDTADTEPPTTTDDTADTKGSTSDSDPTTIIRTTTPSMTTSSTTTLQPEPEPEPTTDSPSTTDGPSQTTEDGGAATSGGLSDVEIALIAVGGVCFVGLVLLFFFVCLRRSRKSHGSEKDALETTIYLNEVEQQRPDYAESYGFASNNPYASNLNVSGNGSAYGIQNAGLRSPASVYASSPYTKNLYTGAADGSTVLPRLVKAPNYTTNY